MNRKSIFSIFVMAVFLAFSYSQNLAWAAGEGYPEKPIRIVVPYGPGGIIDVGVRAMANQLAKELGVPLVIQNKGGAGGMLGAKLVAKAKPDGYTLLAAGDAAVVTAPLQSPNPPYNVFKDFMPICAYGGAPVAFGVYKSSTIQTIADFVKKAKEKPGEVSVGVTSFGGENHLTFEKFRMAAGFKVKLVPYKGTGEGIAALLGKHIDMLILTYVAFLPYFQSGEVRPLAVVTKVAGSPIPDFADAGYPQAALPRFNGFFVPAGTPKPIYEKLVRVFERVSKNPEVMENWKKVGLTPHYQDPSQFTAFMKEKYENVSKLVEELGLRQKGK